MHIYRLLCVSQYIWKLHSLGSCSFILGPYRKRTENSTASKSCSGKKFDNVKLMQCAQETMRKEMATRNTRIGWPFACAASVTTDAQGKKCMRTKPLIRYIRSIAACVPQLEMFCRLTSVPLLLVSSLPFFAHNFLLFSPLFCWRWPLYPLNAAHTVWTGNQRNLYVVNNGKSYWL